MAAQKLKANIQTTRPENDLELIQRIGSGTYGEVYKANIKATGALAAVKIINIEPGDDFDIIQQEIMIMQDCTHENIVQYHGSYLRRDKLWIAMEYCGGGSIQDVYHVTGPLNEKQIAFSCTEMLKGLNYMHAQKKLHRDIKGANILLTSDGDVKLADFGVGAQITSTIGKRSSFIGTPYWMAPEVAAVERTGGYDHICDIWAVGITAIEFAECQPPLFDLHPMRALYLISKRNYTPPVLKNKGKWSSQFKDFLKQSLTKNPKKRPDAERLLQVPFCNDSRSNRSTMRNLLDEYSKNKKRHKNKDYISDHDDDSETNSDTNSDSKPQQEEEKPATVRRIRSKKENKKKEKAPTPPRKEDKPVDKADNSAPVTALSQVHITPINRSDSPSEESADTGTIKAAPPKKQLPPAPQPPRRPPPSVDHRPASASSGIRDSTAEVVPPPLPPRESDTAKLRKPAEDVPTLSERAVLDPPALPPRSPFQAHKERNERPQSQLFTQKAAKNCFSKIFNECPLNIFDAASWTNPDNKAHHLLFATDEGIYSLNLDDAANCEMIQIFSRPCKWVYVLKNMLVSICTSTQSSSHVTYVYMHNLMSLHAQKNNIENYIPMPKGVAYTTKIPGTANTLKCCVAHNPYNNEVYLYAGRKDCILILQWYPPLQKFMIQKDTPCTLAPVLSMFEPIVRKGVEHTSICVGVYQTSGGEFLLDKIDTETGAATETPPDCKKLNLRSIQQLEPNMLLLAYDRTVQFIDIDGKPLNYHNTITKLHFEYNIEDALCLPGSVLTFSTHGVQGKSLHDNQVTANFQDPTRHYKLLCSDRIVVIESREPLEKHSNLYILANDQNTPR